jgi:hypothetical protein
MRTAKPAISPKSISVEPMQVRSERAPTAKDGKLAVAQIAFVAQGDVDQLRSEAKRVGMKSVGNNHFVHTVDGSWAKMTDDGRLERGVKSIRFQGIPVPAVAVPDVAPVELRKLNALMKQKPAIPTSMREYAIAKVGIVNSSNIAAAATAAGFVQLGTRWVHPDGSWLLNDRGDVSVGWKGHALASLPYSGGW